MYLSKMSLKWWTISDVHVKVWTIFGYNVSSFFLDNLVMSMIVTFGSLQVFSPVGNQRLQSVSQALHNLQFYY